MDKPSRKHYHVSSWSYESGPYTTERVDEKLKIRAETLEDAKIILKRLVEDRNHADYIFKPSRNRFSNPDLYILVYDNYAYRMGLYRVEAGTCGCKPDEKRDGHITWGAYAWNFPGGNVMQYDDILPEEAADYVEMEIKRRSEEGMVVYISEPSRHLTILKRPDETASYYHVQAIKYWIPPDSMNHDR